MKSKYLSLSTKRPILDHIIKRFDSYCNLTIHFLNKYFNTRQNKNVSLRLLEQKSGYILRQRANEVCYAAFDF
jgi:hypothetical protein